MTSFINNFGFIIVIGIIIAIGFIFIRQINQIFQNSMKISKDNNVRKKFFFKYQSKTGSVHKKQCKKCNGVLTIDDNYCDSCGAEQPHLKSLPIYSID